MKRTTKVILLILCLLPLGLLAQEKKVFHFKIDDVIDPRTNRHSELALQEATKQNADLVIVELNTYGGIIEDADSIRQRFLRCPVPIYAFINRNAASAGALISISCDKIYMAEGSTIGAATAVTGDGEKASEKIQAYMKGIMRATAEANNRDPRIAEAMVDERIEIDSVIEEGKLITFTMSEAIKHNYCEGTANSLQEVLKLNDLTNYETISYEKPASEKVIAFFLNPAISGVLIMIIIGGIYFELQSPGVGFPLGAAILAGILYLVPYYMNGLAENWEVAIFLVGMILIGLEVFVIPGFGVTGISGIICCLLALFLMMVNNDFFDFTYVMPTQIFGSIFAILMGVSGLAAFIFFGGLGVLNTKAFNRFALQDTLATEQGYSSAPKLDITIGDVAQVFSDLRPSGKILFEGKTLNAESRGEFIGKGESVVIVGTEGTTLIVRKTT